MSEAIALSIDHIVNKLSKVTYNAEKKRYEAHCAARHYRLKHTPYGDRPDAAYQMLRRMLENLHYGIDELHNIPEHENYGKVALATSSVLTKVINTQYHNHGVWNQGVMHDIQSISVVSERSEFSETTNELLKLLLDSKELDQDQKEEAQDRIEAITVELAKPEEKRKKHIIKDAWNGLIEISKGVAAAKPLIAVLAEPIRKLLTGGQ
jgi:hypothetical protein